MALDRKLCHLANTYSAFLRVLDDGAGNFARESLTVKEILGYFFHTSSGREESGSPAGDRHLDWLGLSFSGQ